MKISNELMHDADFGQGIIRIFLGTGVLLYTIWYLESYAGQMNLFLLYLAVGFFLFSIINLVSFWVLNVPILLRRSVCIFIDTGIVTFSMAVFGEAATPFFGGYLWVTIANGIRFGRRYLYITWALSIIGFILVLSISRYWQAHLILGIGILIWIILLPLYVSKLLKNLEQTVAREKQANSVKSQFLANMSHELRTPLNTIIGYTELLEEDARDEKNTQLGEDLGKIKHAAFHLLNLINGVLDLSKIESGKMDVHYEEVELALLGAEVLELIQNQVGKNNSTIELKIADGLHKTYTDYTKLKQVLLNLLSNAAKFTHDGKIALAMNKLHRAGCDWLEIKISDTGIGIDAGYLPHLFEPFMQADSSTTRKYGGTGLGLTITKRFVEMLKGEILVDSKPGQGTCFTVRLPRPAASDLPVERISTMQRIGRPYEDMANRKVTRVLVIDDDPDMRELMARNLTDGGYLVETAGNGLDGLKLARSSRPDVITLDIMMPELDGWAVLKSLKADEALKDIPVVMISMTDQTNIATILGASDYLQKPIDFEQLHHVLHRWVNETECTNILVVDDDKDIRTAIRVIVESQSHRVKLAADGNEALRIMQEFKPDLMLVDLMMPGMDGFELVDHLRKDAQTRDIPVIVMTAKDLTEQDLIRLDELGVCLISKGVFAGESLLKTVQQAVQNYTR